MKKLFVLIAAVVFVVAFTAPAFAAEWSFYGHARMATFWTDTDYGDFMGPTDDNDTDLNHSLQGNSRIGANVKVSDNLVGAFEYGTGVNVRKLYGEYDFGDFKMLVGQTYTPVNIFISNQAFNANAGMLDVGGIYRGRRGMVRFSVGDLKVALVTPNTPAMGAADTDVMMPQIEASYKLSFGDVGIQLVGGYQTYDVVAANDDDDDVTSYIVGAGVTYNAGPLFVGADFYTGTNLGNYGMAGWGGAPNITAAIDADGVLDNDTFGFLIAAGFTANEMLYFEAGYGYVKADLDEADEEDETSAYYVQCKINLAKGVFIIPEVGFYDYKDDFAGDDQGDSTYYGLHWQVRF